MSSSSRLSLQQYYDPVKQYVASSDAIERKALRFRPWIVIFCTILLISSLWLSPYDSPDQWPMQIAQAEHSMRLGILVDGQAKEGS